MFLKIVTSLYLIAGICLLFGWSWMVKMRPVGLINPGVKDQHVLIYEGMYLAYASCTILCFVATASLAMIIASLAREKFRRDAEKNLQSLVDSGMAIKKNKRSGL